MNSQYSKITSQSSHFLECYTMFPSVKRLYTSKPHSFMNINQSQLPFHFQEPESTNFTFWDFSNQRPLLYDVAGNVKNEHGETRDASLWTHMDFWLWFPTAKNISDSWRSFIFRVLKVQKFWAQCPLEGNLEKKLLLRLHANHKHKGRVFWFLFDFVSWLLTLVTKISIFIWTTKDGYNILTKSSIFLCIWLPCFMVSK